MDHLKYEDVCRLTGRLFLESQHELERLASLLESERRSREKIEKERDDALRLLADRGKE